MDITYKNPLVIVIAGKARSGKNTVASLLKKMSEANDQRVIISPYTKYLKRYIEEITGKVIDENNKPRKLLQELGVEIIRERLGKEDMFINRQLDDIDIYSYFFDVIIIPDARFPKEIDVIKEKYSRVVTMKIKSDRANDMTEDEKKHITETSLDSYREDNFDYVINNSSLIDLEKDIKKIYDEIK